ncbi:MAG: WYL domain-containing protein [Candidatus Marinimicrobia bacterium]|nr:WYL domain-containing protein [bacterium]MCG2716975.1 WYL domain-containing protein [Candidatus Neomarinimicrobiota bacterium]
MPDLKPLERQIRILQQFTLKKELTVDFIFELFERSVSRRTIQRDLIALTAANVPLNERKGAHGQIHWSLNPNYLKFIPMTLGVDEVISSLLLKRLGSIFRNTPIADDISALDKKLKQLITDDILSTSDDLQNLEPFFSSLQFGYIDYSDCGEQLQKFLYAAINKRICSVIYKAAYSEKPKRYLIMPYSLLLHRGAFYGIVYQPNHKSYIHLLIHRIQKIDVLDKSFQRDPVFKLEEFISTALGVWHDKPEKVRIKFFPDVATRIAERIWQKDQEIEKQADGSIILELNVAVSYELVAWILRWGSFAEVLAPVKLVDMVRSEVKKLNKMYSDK